MTPSDLDRRARHIRNGHVQRASVDDLRAWRLAIRRRRSYAWLWVALAVALLLVASLAVATRSVRAEVELPATVTPAPSWTPEANAELRESPRFEPASRGGRGAEQWRSLLENYPWNVDQAVRVIDCESEGRAWVWNAAGSGAVGLFQTLSGWRGLAYDLTGSSDLTDPVVNVAVAYYLWRDSGGTFRFHWAASRGCWS